MKIDQLLNKYEAILVSSWANITYLTSYSGFSQTERECFLLLTKKRNFLVTDGRYTEAIKKYVKGFEIIGDGVNNFIISGKQNILGKLNSIAVEEENLTLYEYKALKKIIKKIQGIELDTLRIIKNNNEIDNIKKACEVADKTFTRVTKQLRVGVTEKFIASKIEEDIRNAGLQLSFPPIVAFGKNSSLPHHQSDETKLNNNQVVLLDFGARVNNYCSDMTRTIYFGSSNAKFKKLYQTVLQAQNAVIKLIDTRLKNNSSISGHEIDNTARNVIKKAGYPSIPHSVGHGIGIEVHETPYISPNEVIEIKPGMVFSIEPGIYIPSFGGVRIEDLALIKKDGIELISHSRKEIIEVTHV